MRAKESALGDLARENAAVKAEAPPAALITGLEKQLTEQQIRYAELEKKAKF